MLVYTFSKFKWENGKYLLDKSIVKAYNGDIESCCGASSQEIQAQQAQVALTKQITSQMQTVFGASSSIFQDLSSAFEPILAQGPSQQGFSAGEVAALNSQAITQTGQAYANAKQSIAEQEASMGGGNIALPSGAQIAPQLALSTSAANQTSSELNQINQANYQTGRSNWLAAASGLSGAPGVFNPATSSSNAATSSAAGAASTAADISKQNNSWVNAVTGMAGALGGAAIGAFSGGGSTPAQELTGNFQPTDINPAPPVSDFSTGQMFPSNLG